MSITKKPVLLVVSFGTSFADAREKNITAIENALADAFPEYEVRRAFTSGMILKKLRERDGICIDSVPEAMERLVRDGVQQVVVQPTHVMNGGEFDKMVRDVRVYEGRFQSLKIGRALLSDDHDYDALIETVFSADAAMVAPDTALVYMGHGTDHEANRGYAHLQEKLFAAGYNNIFVGTVEATPTVEDVLALMAQQGGFHRVALLPLMIVAGDHATNDMAGDGKDSWRSIFQGAGFDTVCVLRGLGERPAIRWMIMGHCAETMKA